MGTGSCYYPPMTVRSYYVHETAIVDPGAEIGEGTKTWHFCHVSGGARLGARCWKLPTRQMLMPNSL